MGVGVVVGVGVGVGLGQWHSFCALPNSPGAVGSGSPSDHCFTALGQWAAELPLYTASLPGGSV